MKSYKKCYALLNIFIYRNNYCNKGLVRLGDKLTSSGNFISVLKGEDRSTYFLNVLKVKLF